MDFSLFFTDDEVREGVIVRAVGAYGVRYIEVAERTNGAVYGPRIKQAGADKSPPVLEPYASGQCCLLRVSDITHLLRVV